MPRRIESYRIAGPAGALEALLEEPEQGQPREAAVVCHPHPLHGGTMHNKVVHRLARGLRSAGVVVLRFNFRGVNLSQGVHDHGRGEVDDARAALEWLRGRYPGLPYSLAGFSFGSRVILRLGCALTGARRLLAAGYPLVYQEHEFLQQCSVPKVFIQSTHDPFGPAADLAALVSRLPAARLLLVEAEDHFFQGALDRFEESVVRAVSGSGEAPAETL